MLTDSFRPLYHFSPSAMWMNDPNGLVYYAGEYHLFYQYHPHSMIWGPMHWGHAVSQDLVHWQHLPVALFPDENGMIFSGSAVIDWRNTAGFGKEAMVAIFTHNAENDQQSQSLAYSTDKGRTWTKYSRNPVIPASSTLPNFRDPKVFWYGDESRGHWVMALAVGDMICFYTSPNLTTWKLSGQFGNGHGSTIGVWETPDLFQLPVDGGAETRWVLTVGVGDGASAGGSGTQYFIGNFDGQTFTSENAQDTILWADFGADFYAIQSWSDEPNGRRLALGWMNNWQYARVVPAETARGAMTLPRALSLTRTINGIRLVNQPIHELRTLRSEHWGWKNETISPATNLLADLRGEMLEIIAEFCLTADINQVGFHIRSSKGEYTTIGYDVQKRKLFVDRTHSGQSDFNDRFASAHWADLSVSDSILHLHIFVDRSSVEVFGNHGLINFTDLIFPNQSSQGLQLFVQGEEVMLNSLDVYSLNPAKFSFQHIE